MDDREPLALILENKPHDHGRFDRIGCDERVPPARTPIEPTNLGRLFNSVASKRGGAPAIATNSDEWTYSQIASAAGMVSRAVRDRRAFAPGERVIALLPNSAEYVAAFYGVLSAAGVVVPVSPASEPGALRAVLTSTAPVVVITNRRILATRPDLRHLRTETVDLAVAAAPYRQEADEGHARQATGDELAAIFFTGGSTGSPKGVMLSHRNFMANARAIQEYLRIGPGERPLCVLPFHHAFGNSVWHSHLLAGATIVLAGQTMFPETIVAALADHKCTSLSGVPDLFRLLIERSSLGKTPLPEMRYMAVAGGALTRDLALEVAGRIAPARFYVMYGQTEATARLAYLPPDLLGIAPDGAIGRAVPGMSLEVVDEHDRPAAAGVVGELRAKGPGIMLGYWRNLQATTERLRSGWLYTGDLASCDSDGLICLLGRRNSFVKVAGYRVDPADLEEFALRRLAAHQAVAVAYESGAVGTRLALYLRRDSAAPGLSGPEMTARCRAELPRHSVPDLIEVVKDFPLTSALKIDRPRLSQLAQIAAGNRRISAWRT
jgi:acyl-CoA synthetase (AMP-forming)/AMP-acid ligase II